MENHEAITRLEAELEDLEAKISDREVRSLQLRSG
jgi:hypothetical protein